MTVKYMALTSGNDWDIQNLFDGSSIRVTVTKTTEDIPENLIQDFNRGQDDLSILISGSCGGEMGIYDFISQLIAERFDLPIRVVTVRCRQRFKALYQRDPEDTINGNKILKPLTVSRHDVISRIDWLEYKARHAAFKVERERAWATSA